MGAPDGPLTVRVVEMLTIAGVADLATPTKPWAREGAVTISPAWREDGDRNREAGFPDISPPPFVARINPMITPKLRKIPAITPMRKSFCLDPARIYFSSIPWMSVDFQQANYKQFTAEK
jgi:hypothetical protein